MQSVESLCPVCLDKIHGTYEQAGKDVYLCKTCPEHGEFRTIAWRGGPDMGGWGRVKIPSRPEIPATDSGRGCPYDCGLCAEHNQHTCTAVVDVTSRCNLRCPTCFASAGEQSAPDPDLSHLRRMFESVKAASGTCNVQLSGGEPTVRDDLADIVRMIKDMGFPFVQVNTNGLRFAREAGFADRMAEAGLDSAFFQFDGLSDDIYMHTRGAALLDEKLAALDVLATAGIGVVLVPTVIPGINTHDLGSIIDLAISRSPAVRGVHFQPVSYFGRYDHTPADRERLTLPEVMTLLEQQTGGSITTNDFLPPGCEHSLCSFHANYVVWDDGRLQRVSAGRKCCGSDGCSDRESEQPPILASEGADKAKRFVGRQWAAPHSVQIGQPQDDLDRFLMRAKTHMLAISAMAFQDAWTLDLDRLRGCCIHAVAPDGRLIPFCAYNLTAMDGSTLYRGKI